MATPTPLDAHLGLAPRFEVTIDGFDLGGWQQCSGLEVDFSPYQLQEMGENTTIHNLRGQAKYPNITLTRAVVSQMWNANTLPWLRTFQGVQYPGNAEIILLDAWGKNVANWELQRVIPVKWQGPSLNANQNEIATEKLVLAHEGFSGLAEPNNISLAQLEENDNPSHKIALQFNPQSITQMRANEPTTRQSFNNQTGTSHAGAAGESDGFGPSSYGQAGYIMGLGLNTWSMSKVVFDCDYGATGGTPSADQPAARTIEQAELMSNINLFFKWMESKGSGTSGTVLKFTWKGFLTEPAYVHLSSTEVNYVRLSHEGLPSRVEVNIKLTEVPNSEVSQNPTSGGPGGHRTCQLLDGESLASIAYREYGDAGEWARLAKFNGIDDPFRLRTGSILQIPTRRILNRV